MQRMPNRTIIGLFTIIGIAIFVFIIAIFIGDKIIRSEEDEIVMYFDESVKGLIVGSPISFRGVEIGKVSSIDLIADVDELNFSVPVYVRLSKDQTFRINNNRKIRNKEAFLNDLIKKGLRARLMTQSYLTGQLSIELEILPNIPAVFKANNLHGDIIEIPTTLSPLGELSRGLQNLPIKLTIDKFNNILDVVNKELPVLLGQTSDVVRHINYAVSNNDDVISTTLWNLNKTLNEVGDAARALKNFTDYVERHPESLLKGKRY
ncbi:MAG: MlaD family protein [Rickettsiales bacterium]|nr:MlaD family protein [Rickettsiales bacterium]